MKLAHAKAIVEELVEFEGIPAEVRENYSGRGMYGRTTAAVSTRYSEDVFSAAALSGSNSVAPTFKLTAWAWAA
jgi:hypothetical protein